MANLCIDCPPLQSHRLHQPTLQQQPASLHLLRPSRQLQPLPGNGLKAAERSLSGLKRRLGTVCCIRRTNRVPRTLRNCLRACPMMSGWLSVIIPLLTIILASTAQVNPFTDYSCAVQRDILVHGRLYVSQNYLCFYANIFRWETCLSIRWKDVTAITKEKTALVIPNAILVSTVNEKYFITSFTSRDKAYLMLFRVWQNALMDKPMQPQEMWQWVSRFYIPIGSDLMV